jgi:CHAD domain-containing protein
MNNIMRFNLPDGHDQKQLIDELAGQCTIKTERLKLKRMAIYDTFDWRLFNKSLVLYGSGKTLFLRKLFKNVNIHSADIASPPSFLWDFPDGGIKELLASIIKMRTLFKLVEVYSRSTSYHILNSDEKTVARLECDEIHSTRGKNSPVLASYLWLLPVKGYPKYFRNLAKRCSKAGFPTRGKDDIYFKALAAVNKIPGSYSSTLKVKLDPDMRSAEATKIILRGLLQVIKTNEVYIEKDLDTEFLHDHRVAIRRTRSALSQIKRVFPKQTTVLFKKAFSFVGKLSNQMRDIDVYLLKESAYKAMLPAVLCDDINPFFDYLRKKRSKALKQVISSFESDEYKQIFQDWEAFLNEPQCNLPTTSNAELSILTLSQKIIYKQYRSTIKAGNRIMEKTDDEKLHALRIECKKLRYLMEFFSSLFFRKKIKRLIRQLKKLQDNLGDFNDLSIQGEYLLNIVEKLPATSSKNKNVLVAIGSLAGALDEEKRIVREMFAKTFTDYASPPNKRLFRELFSSKQKKEVL